MENPDGFELAGRNVVVTGGAGALGGAVVEWFRQAGALCHVPVRTGSPPVAAAAELDKSKGEMLGLPAVRYVPDVELSDEGSVASFYEGLPGPLWASVHLAGGFAMSPIAATSAADLRGQLEQNLVTAFLCSREAVKAIRRARDRQGGRREGAPGTGVGTSGSSVPGGRIVQVASRSGLFPAAGQLAYSASKAALVALTAGLAAELAAERILVNAVAPGTMDTPGNRRAMPNADPGKWVAPAEVAALIGWLASPANARASGATIPVFGES
jgi:NAD(P)-dependent dehydrogenase (short-subunit alcohol dehydrogenase family)